MSENLFNKVYNPDVLSCLANLSNDEVFTPPEIVNQMLDMLPQELFKNPDTTFLDPACKTGVFLREIAKRLIKGLEPQFPDLQERIDHIFHKQLFGIAITELTSLLSRRGIYCSKYPNTDFSVSKFDTAEGNIRFKLISHTWVGGKCIYCGANEKQYERGEELETHAYEFIHKKNAEEILNMKFDVIIGNPPYQLSTGGSKAQAIPLYNKFVEQAKKLNPRFLMMIIPDRWFAGGFGLNSFRDDMLNDKSIRVLYDYPVASDCFPGVDIPGGICYFLRDRDYKGDCTVYINYNDTVSKKTRPLLEDGCDVFIKYNEAVPILKKIKAFQEPTFDTIVTSQRPFGLPTNFNEGISTQNIYANTLVYGRNQEICYYPKSKITINNHLIDKYKIFISAAYGERVANNYFVIGKPFLGKPGSICTETYVAVGCFDNEKLAINAIDYMKTKFFRFLLLVRKPTQHILKSVYGFAPIQDFSKPWTDEELYAKYGLTQEEIDFIESMIRPME